MLAAMRSVQLARPWLWLLGLLTAGALSGCASVGEVQRATQGPTADGVWVATSRSHGRKGSSRGSRRIFHGGRRLRHPREPASSGSSAA